MPQTMGWLSKKSVTLLVLINPHILSWGSSPGLSQETPLGAVCPGWFLFKPCSLDTDRRNAPKMTHWWVVIQETGRNRHDGVK